MYMLKFEAPAVQIHTTIASYHKYHTILPLETELLYPRCDYNNRRRRPKPYTNDVF